MSWNKDEEIPQNITNGENRKPKKKKQRVPKVKG